MRLSRPLRRCLIGPIGLVFLALASLNPAAAAPVVALHVDFDQDALDSPPALFPPGAPAEDELRLFGSVGTWTVREAVGGMTNQPLELERAGGTGDFTVWAKLDPAYNDCPSYTVSWRSMVLSNVFFIPIVLRAPQAGIIASLEYRGLGVLTYNTSLNELSVGYNPGVEQLFEITLDRVARTSSLSIDGVPIPEAQNMSVNNYPSFERVAVEFGGIYPATMVIDDIHVVGDCTVSPVDPAGWGRVKAWYR